MPEAPPFFLRTIAQHNRHCWLTAAASLFGAWLAWLLVGAFYTALVLLFETIRIGGGDFTYWPPWLIPVGVLAAGLLLVWAGIDKAARRFRPVSDRRIIGWHLVPDLLLLPARMTLAIWDHVGTRITLPPDEQNRAWRLLLLIHEKKRVPLSEVNVLAGAEDLEGLLLALQLTQWIDLHRGDDDWFYRVRSDAEEDLRRLTDGAQGGHVHL